MMGAPSRRSRRQLTLVAAGHEGNVTKELACEEPTGVVLKVVDAAELEFYRVLSKSSDPLKKFIPEFSGATTLGGEWFLRLQNVNAGFRCPYVMDCKIGTRTFLEKEAQITKPREDLFQRATSCAMHNDLLTQEEKDRKFITKYRWMSIHDASSTTQSLGFRIDGVAGKKKVEKPVLTAMRTREDVVNFLHTVYMSLVTEGSYRPGLIRGAIVRTLTKKLREFRKLMEESPILKRIEIIGSSLLILADSDGRCGVYLIDFAKSHPLPAGVHIDHRKPWVCGNHEDGALFGVDNVISIFDEVHLRIIEENRQSQSQKGALWWISSLLCPFRKNEANQEEEIVVNDNKQVTNTPANVEQGSVLLEDSQEDPSEVMAASSTVSATALADSIAKLPVDTENIPTESTLPDSAPARDAKEPAFFQSSRENPICEPRETRMTPKHIRVSGSSVGFLVPQSDADES